MLSTAANVVFAGSNEGYFCALDAETGEELWHIYLGGARLGGFGGAAMSTAATTYLSNVKQLVTMSAGLAAVTFELGEP